MALTLAFASFAVAQSPAPERVVEPPAKQTAQDYQNPAPALVAAASASSASAAPSNLTPWGMFLHANFVVQIVMIGLTFASLVTWTIALVKTVELSADSRAARRALETLAGAASLSAAQKSLANSPSPVALLIEAAAGEAQRSAGLPVDGVKERVGALLSRLEANAGRKMARGAAIIATIGATAPFVGLFGTVWGIMDSFIGISKTHTTNLAVVAPGIAEALLATAMGLIAAIPAVIIYNAFARGLTAYRALLGDAGAEVLRHLSRDLDRDASSPSNDASHVFAMRRPAE